MIITFGESGIQPYCGCCADVMGCGISYYGYGMVVVDNDLKLTATNGSVEIWDHVFNLHVLSKLWHAIFSFVAVNHSFDLLVVFVLVLK